jgi:hypothetical protein
MGVFAYFVGTSEFIKQIYGTAWVCLHACLYLLTYALGYVDPEKGAFTEACEASAFTEASPSASSSSSSSRARRPCQPGHPRRRPLGICGPGPPSRAIQDRPPPVRRPPVRWHVHFPGYAVPPPRSWPAQVRRVRKGAQCRHTRTRRDPQWCRARDPSPGRLQGLGSARSGRPRPCQAIHQPAAGLRAHHDPGPRAHHGSRRPGAGPYASQTVTAATMLLQRRIPAWPLAASESAHLRQGIR